MDEGAVTHRDPIETLCRSVAGGLVDWLLWPWRKLMSCQWTAIIWAFLKDAAKTFLG